MINLAYSNKFLKSIPKGMYEKVINKCNEFYNELIDYQWDIRGLRKGFWTKKLSCSYKNTYEFRLNIGDRIIFCYLQDGEEDNYNKILFLFYKKHNDVNKSIKHLNSMNIEIDKSYVKPMEHGEILEDKIEYNKYEKIVYSYVDLQTLEFGMENIINYDKYNEILNKEYEDKYLYRMNHSQKEAIVASNGKAFILTGSAGSGKTTVSFYKLLSLLDKCERIAYITYTKELKDKMEEDFKNITIEKYHNKVDFITLENLFNEYSKEDSFNKASRLKLITYNVFKNWYEDLKIFDNNFKSKYDKEIKEKYDSFDVYSEIRGQIKGGMGKDFIRAMKGKDQVKDILSKKLYLDLPEDYSYFHKDARKIIYKFTEEYYDKLFLVEQLKKDYIDDNNECYKLLKKNTLENKYDYIIIDEAQDFTDLQLYTFMDLVEDKNNVFISGDSNQIVNSTFYSDERINSLFYSLGIKPVRKDLRVNYRNQQQILNLANGLEEIRCKKLGRFGKIHEKEEAIERGNFPVFCNINSDELDKFFNIATKKSYITVLVSSYKDKNLLRAKHSELDIFEVREFKGLEQRYIICYNLVSSNLKYFNNIFKEGYWDKTNIYSQKYRYYFNLLYVAITRAKENICFIEREDVKVVYKQFKDFIKEVNVFSEEELHLLEASSIEEYLVNARTYEKNHKYEQAANNYKKAGTCYKNDYYRVLSLKEYEEGKYKEAFNIILKNISDDYEYENITKDDLSFKMLREFNTLEDKLNGIVKLNNPIKYFYKLIEKYSFKEILENHKLYKPYNNEVLELLTVYLLQKLQDKSYELKISNYYYEELLEVLKNESTKFNRRIN